MLSLIGRVRPDVVTLNEVSAMWAEKLALLSSAYPYRIVCTMDNRAGGVAILSLRPFCGRLRRPMPRRRNLRDRHGRFRRLAGRDRRASSALAVAVRPGQADRGYCAAACRDGRNGDPRRRPQRHAVERRLGSIADAAGMTPVGPAGPTWLYRALPEMSAVRRAADRPGFCQGRHGCPLGEHARSRRLGSPAGAG